MNNRSAAIDDGKHAPPDSSLVGTWIHGRYEVLSELGWGSLGHVYAAHDHLRKDAQGRPGRVALKVIRRDRLSERSVAFLKLEFRALSRLDHPHVARVHDLDVVPGRGELFFSLELLEGPTIVARTRRQDGGPALLVELLVQALRALVYVHDRGLIHMDLKPQNLLVVERPEGPTTKLLDFHLAREADAPLEREMRGTIAYMPPEVIAGREVDLRADLYSLGAVAYEALSGKPPFAHAGSAMDMLRAHAKDDPPPLAGVEPALEAVVKKLLAKDPAARFGSAEEVIRALSAATGRSFPLETEETRRRLIRAGRFVGRDDELEQVLRPARLLVQPAGGGWEPWVWLVRGEPGSGRSRLLQELRVACQLEGLPCLHLAPRGVDAAPFGPVREALAELLRRAGRGELLAEVADETGAVDPGKLVQKRGDPSLPGSVRHASALRELLEELARTAPFALLLDDLERADDGTLAVLQALASGPAPRLLVVASCVTGWVRAGELLPLPGVASLELRQLGLPATRELVRSMVPGAEVAEELVERVWALAGGNPRFTSDALRGLVEDLTAASSGTPRLDAAAAERLLSAESLRELSARRVARLESDPALLLAALACSPRPRSLPFAAAVARVPLGRARIALEELLRRGFAERPEGAGWDPEQWPIEVEHEPLREAALAAATPDAKELHARAARLLESRHPVAAEVGGSERDRAEELLFHLEGAGDAAGALRYAWQAGQAALRRGEPRRARELLERGEALRAALVAAGRRDRLPPQPDRTELLAPLAEALAQSGDAPRGVSLLRRLAEEEPGPRVLRLLGALLRDGGALREALERFDQAAGLVGNDAPEAARIEAERARALLWIGDYRATLAAGQAALAGFAVAGEPPPGELLLALVHASQFLGRPAEAQEWLRRGLQGETAVTVGQPLLGDASGVQVARAPLEAALGRSERMGDAARHYARRVQLLEAAGDAEGAAWAELNLAHLRRAAGEHLGARVAYERARRGFEAARSPLGVALVRLGLARGLAEGGAPARAREEAGRAAELGESVGARWIAAQAEVARAEAALVAGDAAAASTAIAAATERARSLEHAPLLGELDLLEAERALLVGDEVAAERALAAWDETPGGAPSALLAARADLARARRAVLAGHGLPPAEGRAGAALSLAERAGLPELAWRAAAVRATVRAARGAVEQELEDLVTAMEGLRGLTERVPPEDRAAYLAHPERRALRERFRQVQESR